MIKAYHSTRTVESLEKILAEGAILPGIYRLNEEAIRGACEKDAKGYDARYGLNPVVVGGLSQLIDEFIRDHAEMFIRKAGPTALRCPDILVGDAGRVFLSAYRWTLARDIEKRRFPKTGLSFDAIDLVKKGAAVRPFDLYGHFHWELIDKFQARYASREQARENIARGLASRVEAGSLYGDEAIAYLHKGLKDDQILYDLEQEDVEVVWEGPLPVEWAVEEWRNGRVTQRIMDL